MKNGGKNKSVAFIILVSVFQSHSYAETLMKQAKRSTCARICTGAE